MLVLAALLHGLVILGVSFTAPGAGDGPVDRGMEVLLVSDELPEARENDTATYLSQRTQTGSGNTAGAPRRPAARRRPAADAAPAHREQRETAAEGEQLLASSAPSGGTPHPDPAPAGPATGGRAQGNPARRSGPATMNWCCEALSRDELYVAADTRASRLAPYLDGWRRRVERIGTLNYPSAAQRQGPEGQSGDRSDPAARRPAAVRPHPALQRPGGDRRRRAGHPAPGQPVRSLPAGAGPRIPHAAVRVRVAIRRGLGSSGGAVTVP